MAPNLGGKIQSKYLTVKWLRSSTSSTSPTSCTSSTSFLSWPLCIENEFFTFFTSPDWLSFWKQGQLLIGNDQNQPLSLGCFHAIETIKIHEKGGNVCPSGVCDARTLRVTLSPIAENYYLWLSSSPPTHRWLSSGKKKKKNGKTRVSCKFLFQKWHIWPIGEFSLPVQDCGGSLDKGRVSASIPRS